MAGQSPAIGVVIVDQEGTVIFAAGIGKHQALAAPVGRRQWRADALKRRLVAIELDDRKYRGVDPGRGEHQRRLDC